MIKENFGYYFLLIFTIIFGVISPYIDHFVIIQLMYLLIPLVLILILTSLYLFYRIIKFKKQCLQNEFIKYLFVLPIFLTCQVISIVVVREIQLHRIKGIVTELEIAKSFSNEYPLIFQLKNGLKYHRISNDEFEIVFKSGFLVNEIYNNKDKITKRIGWND